MEALAGPTDEFLTHALTFALHRVAGREALETGLEHSSPKVQRAALLLIAQPPFNAATPEQVRERLFAEYEPLRETARWVLDQHSDWGEVGAAFVTALVRRTAPTEADRAALSKAIPEFQSKQTVIDAVTECLASAQSGVTDEQRGRLLEVLSVSQLKSVPDAWGVAIRNLLGQDRLALLTPAIEAVSALRIPGAEPGLRRIARDPNQSAAVRISALRELVRRDPKLDEPARRRRRR